MNRSFDHLGSAHLQYLLYKSIKLLLGFAGLFLSHSLIQGLVNGTGPGIMSGNHVSRKTKRSY